MVCMLCVSWLKGHFIVNIKIMDLEQSLMSLSPAYTVNLQTKDTLGVYCIILPGIKPITDVFGTLKSVLQ